MEIERIFDKRAFEKLYYILGVDRMWIQYVAQLSRVFD